MQRILGIVSFAGESHLGLIVAIGVWIAIVFAIVVRVTDSTRHDIVAALAGSIVAAGANIATDTAAHAAGFWRYTEVTTPFGPLLYYLEAGVGCAALALILAALRTRRARFGFIVALAVYGPIRDWATAELTHLIEFHYQPAIVVVTADALSSFVIPVLAAYATLQLARARA
jgi:hypothetical protein